MAEKANEPMIRQGRRVDEADLANEATDTTEVTEADEADLADETIVADRIVEKVSKIIVHLCC